MKKLECDTSRLLSDLSRLSSRFDETRAAADMDLTGFAPTGVKCRKMVGLDMYIWIWIAPGTTNGRGDMFLDAVSGGIYCVANSPFASIDTVWNDRNVWIRIHANIPISATSLDLGDSRQYEPVLLDDAGASSEVPRIATVHEAMIARQLWLTHPRLVDNHKLAQSYLLTKSIVWVGSRSTFEPFPEYSQPDGLITRICHYSDFDRENVVSISEIFAHRLDRLRTRVTNPKSSNLQETFDHGRADSVKSTCDCLGNLREVNYYSSRPDGLVQTVYIDASCFIERYKDRIDKLLSLKATFDCTIPQAAKTLSFEYEPVVPSSCFDDLAGDPAAPILGFCRQVSFDHVHGSIALRLHSNFSTGIQNRHIILKRDNGSLVAVDSAGDAPFILTDSRLDQLSEIEKVGNKSLADSLASFREVETSRRNEQQMLLSGSDEIANSYLIQSVFDDAANKAACGIFDAATAPIVYLPESGDAIDILTAHLLQFEGFIIDISKAEAIAASAKADLKRRLLERSDLIRARVFDEQDQLDKRRDVYRRKIDDGDCDPEFSVHEEQCKLRISILEQTLARYESQAVSKFADLERALRSHPRLINLWT